MQLYPNQIYHVYNRGNQRQRIFFTRDNYLFFLQKVRQYWLPCCDILCYCLMPNHFHFLIRTHEKTVLPYGNQEGPVRWTQFSRSTQQILTRYTRALQKQEHFTGSLFTQNTKAKRVSSEWSWEDYTLWCFLYILQNPQKAGLVVRPEDWEFSAYRDFVGLRSGTLCNIALAMELLGLEQKELGGLLEKELATEVVKKLW